MIDSYCERTAEGLLNEPLNVATNLAFFIAGALLWRNYRERLRGTDYLLVAHLFLIGAGSLLFHLFANSITLLMDVIPILIFQLLWLWLMCSRIFGYTANISSLLTLLYFAFAFAISRLPDPTHGSVGYLAPLATITSIGWLLRTGHPSRGKRVRLAAGIFLVSLSFRTADLALCALWPYGTHFVWHGLNAVVLYACASALFITGNGVHVRRRN